MKKCISLVLAIILMLTLLPATASAEGSQMRASDDIINVIKSFEGFSSTPYKATPSEKYLTIGYGHYGADVTEDMEITEAEATELLRADLVRFENSVNGFFNKHNLSYSQQVFDAVLSLTYNIGSDWMNASNYRIRNYLINGIEKYDEVEIADALGVICSADGVIYPGLINRRIREARIMLYGDYYGSFSQDFTYLILDANGGSLNSGNRVAIYVKGQPYGTMPGAYKEGFVLKSWQTANGTVINENTTAAEGLKLKAIWGNGAVKKYVLTVDGGTGSGKYAEGETVTIFPGKTSKGEFLAWQSGDVKIITAEGGYSFKMPGNDLTITSLRDYNCSGKFCPSESFTDIGSSFWAHDAIDFVYENNLFKGFTDTIFNPDVTMSRGMLVTVLYRLNGSPSVDGYENPFSDVKADSPYHDAILWGYHNRIANGYADGTFSPNTTLKREHLAVFLLRYANYMGYDTNKYGDIGKFSDAGLVTDYADEALCWAIGNGIINGTSATTLGPQQGATRAQVATMVTRFVRNVVAGAVVEELT